MFPRRRGLFPSRGIKAAMQELSQTPSGRRQQLRRKTLHSSLCYFFENQIPAAGLSINVFSKSLDHIDQTDSLTVRRWRVLRQVLLMEFHRRWPGSSVKLACVNGGPLLWPSLYLRGKQMSQAILISLLSYRFVFKTPLWRCSRGLHSSGVRALVL